MDRSLLPRTLQSLMLFIAVDLTKTKRGEKASRTCCEIPAYVVMSGNLIDVMNSLSSLYVIPAEQ